MGSGVTEGSSGETEAAAEYFGEPQPSATILCFTEWGRRVRIQKAARKAAQKRRERRKARALKSEGSSLKKLDHACAKARLETGTMSKEDYQYLCIVNGWVD